MEIQAIVVHEPPDEGMKWEAQSAEEVGKEYDPLMGPGGGIARVPAGILPLAAQLFDVLLRTGGGQPLASRSGHGWIRLRWEVRTWALELECAKTDEQRRKKAWMKKVNPYPFIWADETIVPTSLVKLAYPPSAVINSTVGLPTPVLMRIP